MEIGRVIDTPEGTRSHDRSIDRWIAAIAAAQHGRVTRRQLLASGISPHEIATRVRSGYLIREFPGVYAVGHSSRGWEARWMAAVLSAGDDSALSHLAGAAHLALVRQRPSVIDVTCHRALRPRPPFRFHRSRLAPDEVMVHDGIPVTTVSRTLLDLAGILSSARLALAINEAEVQQSTSHLSLPELLDRHSRRPGAGAIREILASGRIGHGRTESELEDLFQVLVAEEALPQPLTNAAIELPSGPVVVDCLWLPQRVVLELDGEKFHDTSRRRRQDLTRDRALAAAGYRPLRAGWNDVVSGRRRLVGQLRRILGLTPRQ